MRAHHVVLAAGVPSGHVLTAAAKGVLPVSTFVGVTEPLGERIGAAVQFPGAVSDGRRTGHYFRRIGDRLLWGSGITVRQGTPRGLARRLAREIGATFPDLAGAKVEAAWSGTMAYAVHAMPQVGELSPGVWLAAAFGGHGLNTTAMAGELVASGIAARDERWKLFAPFGVVGVSGVLGKLAVEASYWGARLGDFFREGRDHRPPAAPPREHAGAT